MIQAIDSWSRRSRLIVLGLAASILLYGYVRLPSAPVEVVPDFNPPTVEVQTEALGLSATEVEQLITVPLEADLLQGVAFLDSIESQSVAGLSSITMRFEPGTDIFRARQVVAERLTQAHALPQVSKPPLMLQPLASTSRFLMVALTTKDLSLIDMSILAQWTVRPRLLGVPGVANVSIWGLRDRQLQVLVDPARLRDQRLALQHVLETAGNAMWVSPLTFLDASTPGTGGFIDTSSQRLGVQHEFPIHSAADLAEVPVAPEDTGGRIVRLGDIATVVEDHQPLIGDAVVGDGDGLMLVVEKFPGVDTLAVTRNVEAALAAMQPGLSGVEVRPSVYRPASYIEEAVANVGFAIGIGVLLLALVLVLLSRDRRTGLIALLGTLFSLVAAALALVTLGITLNAIMFAGLALGSAVVVDLMVGGVNRPTTGFKILISLLVAGPLFFVGGTAGALLPSLAAGYLAAVLVSAIAALTVVPALASILRLDSEAPAGAEERAATTAVSPLAAFRAAVDRVGAAHLRAVGQMVSGRRAMAVTIAAMVASVAVSFGAVAMAGQSIAAGPAFHERDLLITWNAAPGTSHIELRRIVGRASTELRALPGVADVGAHVGRAITSDQVTSVNSSQIWVSIAPDASYDSTVASVENVVAGYPGFDRAVVTYAAQRMQDVLGQSSNDLVVRIYGQDLDVLNAEAEEVRAAVTSIDGVTSAEVERQVVEPTLQIAVDLAKAQQFGLKAGDVRRSAAIILSGVEAGSIFEEQKIFSVVVWGAPELRQSVESIKDLQIQAPGGVFVRLGDVADVRIAPTPSVIRREGVFRRVDVAIQIADGQLGAVTTAIKDRVGAITFPLEYHAELFEPGAARQAQLALFAAIAGAVALWTFLLMQAALNAWRKAAALLIVAPLALLGSGLAFLAVGGGPAIGAAVGIVAVLAIALRHVLEIADRCHEAAEADPDAADEEIVLRGVAAARREVAVSALAIAALLLPVIVLGDVAGLELLRPMAAVVVGGALGSLALNLFIVPAVSLWSGSRGEPDIAAGLLEQPAPGLA